jgi:hypothetical protein
MNLRLLTAAMVSGALLAGVYAKEEAKTKLRVSGKQVDYAGAFSPADAGYPKALTKAAEFPANQQLKITGMMVLADGTPLPGLSVHLFPVNEKGPELILGLVDGGFGYINTKATTDAAGRFTLLTGPLWKHTDKLMFGLVVQRAPDRPFDIGILPFEGTSGPYSLALSEEQREHDLGKVQVPLDIPGMPRK